MKRVSLRFARRVRRVYVSGPSSAATEFLLEGALMIFGMTILTFVHVLLSLLGILAGLVVMSGYSLRDHPKAGPRFSFWPQWHQRHRFLFPFHRFLAVTCCRYSLAVSVDDCDLRIVWQSTSPGLGVRAYAVNAMIALT